jgi:hypothetical protein
LAKEVTAESECYCQLKSQHSINVPNREFLTQIGMVNYWIQGDKHPLYQCNKCGYKWVLANLWFDGPPSQEWVTWNEKYFTLVTDNSDKKRK